jgi:hypothetical protein
MSVEAEVTTIVVKHQEQSLKQPHTDTSQKCAPSGKRLRELNTAEQAATSAAI